ncbi:MAG: hypothetical protein ASARMPREDX12_006370 [Alectoria sarmentosa]|nr:MAG: hypothetical protein ASARMPREDX12_006370 [Alectoria sarmentosa]
MFSTGLLVLSPTSITSPNVTLTATTQFGPYNGPSTQDLPATPWYTYYGILENGLGYPNGTSNDVAFQSLEPKSGVPRNATITATVSAFYPQLDCEVADIHHSLTTNVSADAPGPALGIVLNTASCTASNSKGLCDPQTQDCPSQAFIYDMYTLNGIFSNDDCQIASDDAYMLFVIGDVRYEQNASSGSLPSQEVSIANISGLICKPSYTISPAQLVLNPALAGTLAGATISRAESAPSTTLPGFTNSDLTNFWYDTLSAIGTVYNNVTDVDETLFHFMADANNHSGIELLLDPSVQSVAASAVFAAVMAQFAREYLLAPTDSILEGQVAYKENRLHVRGLSVWLIVAGLILLICAAIVVLLYRPYDVVPRNPNSIAFMSTILASSDSLRNSLQSTGHLPDEALQQHLSGNSYQTAFSHLRGSFMIERQEASNWPLPPSRLSKMMQTSVISPSRYPKHHRGQSNSVSSNGSESRWWRPFTLGLPFVLVSLALPIVAIVILEVIQQYSNKHDGLVDIPDALTSAEALSNYLPAAFMMVISIMFNSADLTVMIFAPYSALARGNLPARRTILSNVLGKIPVLGLVEAIIVRHWAVCFSTIAAIVGTLLTIVVSGLYIPNAVPGSSSISIQRGDQFNLTWTNSVNNDSNAGTMFALIEESNLSYPKFTYDELALPTIQLVDQGPDTHEILQVQLPATRATLNCTVVPSQGITVSTSNQGSGGQANVTVEAPLPENCLLGGPEGNDPSITFNNNFQMSLLKSTLNESYCGIVLDLHVAPSFGDSIGFQSYGEGAGSSEADNPPGCPSLGFIFGYFTVGDDTNTNASALVCSQLMEEVQAETHFLLPSLDLDPRNPPIPDESTAKYLVNQTDALPYRIQVAFDGEVTAYNSTSAFQPGSPTALDPFFQSLLYGQGYIDPISLTGPGNTGRLIKTTNHIYRRYMAQAMNSNMRENLSSADRPTIDAILINPNGSRLAQDEVSKVVLQVLLAIMLVCGTSAYLLSDTKRVLPHSPTSIAGVASLLAESELVDASAAPRGTESIGDKEMKRGGIFEGGLFGLGWWEGGEEGRGERRFGIGVGKAQTRI